MALQAAVEDRPAEGAGDRGVRARAVDARSSFRELYPPLREGKIRTNGAARPLSLAKFVQAVAEREGVPPEDAREHARAVLSTLREAVSEKEFSDTVAQLPDEYWALFSPR